MPISRRLLCSENGVISKYIHARLTLLWAVHDRKEEDMALEKNDIVRLTISDIGTDGEGIGKVDGYTLFVKDAVIGDTITARVIKLKKNYGYGNN